MRNILRSGLFKALIIVTAFLFVYNANGQLNPASYTFFTDVTGDLSTDLNSNAIDMTTGATQHIGPSSTTTANAINLTFPFPFRFLNENITFYSVAVNGVAGLNFNAGTGNNIVGGTGNRIGAFVTGLSNSITHSTGYVRSKVVGTAPLRCLVIEWRNISMTNISTTADGTWQLRFYETSNAIEMVYGDMAWGAGSSTSVRTGFSINTTAGNYNQVLHSTHANSTTTSHVNTYNTVGPITALNGGGTPTSRRLYRFTGPNVSLDTSVAAQVVGSVISGQQNAAILRLALTVSGLNQTNPINLTEIIANANGSNSLSNITNAKIYYTGNDINFNTSTQYGTTLTSLAGNFTFNGTQNLLPGTNYFWLTYDVSPSAIGGDSLDGSFVQVTANSLPRAIGNSSPVGSRLIVAPFAGGTYTIGVAGDFPNLRIPFNQINSSGISGDVTFEIISDVTDTAAAVLGQWQEAGLGNYSITIRPTGSTRSYTSNVPSSGVLVLAGADRVTIDGRIGGIGNNLTIANSNTTTLSTAILLAGQTTVAGGSNNVTIRNTTLRTGTIGSSTIATAGIQVQGTGSPSNNLSISNNIFERSYYGLFVGVNTPTSRYLNLSISDNTFGSADTAFRINLRSIDVRQSDGAVIQNNLIQNQISPIGATIAGIDVSTNNNALIIRNNTIREVRNLNTGGWGSYGISLAGGDGHQVYNNAISGIGTINYNIGTTFSAQGIRVVSGTNHLIAFNTVIVEGNYTNTGFTVASGAPLVITSTTVTATVRNNILINRITTNATGNKILPIIWLPSGFSFANLTMDNNSYFHSGETYHTVGQVGTTFNTGVSADLPAWRTNSGKDANSFFENPLFVTSTLVPTSPVINNTASPISGITTDITGASRNVTTPDPGAYEFVPVIPPNLLGSFNLLSPTNNATVNVAGPSTNTISIQWSTCTNGGSGTVSYQWKLDTIGGNFSPGLASINSNNAGLDTTLTLTLAQVDALLSSLGVAVGNSVTLNWTVRAFVSPNDTFATNGPFTITLTRGVVVFPYCTPTVTLSGDTDIGRFTFGSLQSGSAAPVLSNPAATGTYLFDTINTGVFSRGLAYPVEISQITSGGTFYSAFGYIYIDYNKNGLFEAAELVLSGGPTGPTTGPSPTVTSVTGTITIPLSAPLGVTRMRVILRESGTLTPAQDPCGTFSYGEIEDYLITISAPPLCLPSFNLAVGSITSNSANISWSRPNPSIGTQVQYGTSGFILGTGTTVNIPVDSSFTIAGLSGQTAYQAYVRNICATGDTSSWSPAISFTTLCASVPLPYTETFDSTSTSVSCWTLGTGWSLFNVNATGGTGRSSRFNFYNISAGTRSNMVSAPIAITPANHRLRFAHAYAAYTGGEIDTLIVYTSSNNGSTWNQLVVIPGGANGPLNTAGTSGPSFTPTTASQWSTFSTAIPTGVNLIRFEAVSDFGNNLYIDDVRVEPQPSCTVPTNLSASAIGTSTATLRWNPVTPSITYQIQYGPTGFTLGSGTTVSSTDTIEVLSGLLVQTTYQAYVRNVCASGDTSSWSAPISFTTLCNPVTVPYSQNFDGVTAPAIPACFTRINSVSNSNWQNVNGTLLAPPIAFPSSPNAMVSFFDATQPKNDWFFLPSMTLDATQTYKLQFQYRGAGWQGVGENLRVVLSNTQSPAGSLDTVWVRTNLNMTAFVPADTNFTVPSTGVYSLGFHAFSVADLDFIAVDDIQISIVSGLQNDKSIEGLSIFPNPSNGIFNIKLSDAKNNATVTITDVAGKQIISKVYNTDSGLVDDELNMSGYAKGVYYATFVNGDSVKTIKLIVD